MVAKQRCGDFDRIHALFRFAGFSRPQMLWTFEVEEQYGAGIGGQEEGGQEGDYVELGSIRCMSLQGEQGPQDDLSAVIRSRFGSTCSMPHPTSSSQSHPTAALMQTQPVIGRSQFPRLGFCAFHTSCKALDLLSG